LSAPTSELPQMNRCIIGHFSGDTAPMTYTLSGLFRYLANKKREAKASR